MRSIGFVLTTLLALAACDRGTQGADITTEEAEADGNIVGNSSSSKPPDADTGSPTIAAEIPVALQGRWGLVPADCEPGRADAKGLLTIEPGTLRFYESVATLGTVTEARPNRIRATFDFEGEGMTWQRDMSLEVEDGGPTLIRREYGTDAAPEPFRYLKCSQET